MSYSEFQICQMSIFLNLVDNLLVFLPAGVKKILLFGIPSRKYKSPGRRRNRLSFVPYFGKAEIR